MHYPLQERFLGAFLGGMVGEKLSTIGHCKQTHHFFKKDDYQQVFWLQSNQKIIAKLPLFRNNSWSWTGLEIINREKMTSSRMILAVLPLILYYHDDLSQLEFFLYQTVQERLIPLSSIDSILLWSSVLIFVLREKLVPEDFWQQLRIITELFAMSGADSLSKLKMLFEQDLSIMIVAKKLSMFVTPDMLPFFLSLYCFYQTPEDFALTIKQASCLQNEKSDTLALTGILSGAYNSRYGLNINWEKSYLDVEEYQVISQLCCNLMALWSGLQIRENNIDISAIIAAPRSFQNRPDLAIISQKEYESK